MKYKDNILILEREDLEKVKIKVALGWTVYESIWGDETFFENMAAEDINNIEKVDTAEELMHEFQDIFLRLVCEVTILHNYSEKTEQQCIEYLRSTREFQNQVIEDAKNFANPQHRIMNRLLN